MQALASSQTEPAESEIRLQALSSIGKVLSELPSVPLAEGPGSPRPSSESYDSDLHTATKCRFIKVEPATNLPLRVKVRRILRNKTARRSLQITAWMAIITTIYYGISLFPAFWGAMDATRSVNLQIESESDSRQSVAYAFLQECENRKNGDLPLGPDCIKYLSKSPKAPNDIDNWFLDGLEANSTNLVLAARGLAMSTLGPSERMVFSSSKLRVERWTPRGWKVTFWSTAFVSTLLILCDSYDRVESRRRRATRQQRPLTFFSYTPRATDRLPTAHCSACGIQLPDDPDHYIHHGTCEECQVGQVSHDRLRRRF